MKTSPTRPVSPRPALALPLFAATVLTASAVPTGVQVPVIINLYPNAGTTEAQARDIIKESNKILKQAGYKLVPVKVNTIGQNTGGANQWGGDNGAGGGTAGDGKFTREERDAARTFGGTELRGLPNKRGIKISFGDTPIDGTTTPGVAIHKNPTVIVKNRPGATAAQSGIITAHEIGHVLTLPGHETANDNLMTPVEPPGGNTKLTAAQIAELQKVKYDFGKCATQFKQAFPAVKDAEQFGGASDARGDQGSLAYFDLDQVTMHSLDGAADQTGGDVDNIHASFSVNGVLPSSGLINATYAFGINSDGTAAGVTYAGLGGVDRIAYLTATGDISLGTFTLTGQVLNTTTLDVTPLPAVPTAAIESEIGYSNDPAFPLATTFLMDIPKSLLDLTASSASVVVASGEIGSIADISDDILSDTTDLVFNGLNYAEDPTITTFGTGIPDPGGAYPIEISGLTPNDQFNLFLDDLLVLTGFLDSSGNYSGFFDFPSFLSNKNFYFLTAQDSTGEFAYNITCPMPEGSTWLEGLAPACLLPAFHFWLRRRRARNAAAA